MRTIKQVIIEILLTHFSAIMGYGFWIGMIVFMCMVDGHRFDKVVEYMLTSWTASVATYIKVKAIGPGGAGDYAPGKTKAALTGGN
jgi:hypothetical protein